MTSDIKQNIKHLKVDNWSVFFLHRLQLLFAKGDCCDLTLKFSEGQELRVHRLVLNTCTTYFDSFQLNNNTISLPYNLKYHALQPIINFMYSGRLEFKPELHPILLTTAKILNMAILTKLLNAQKGEEGDTKADVKKSPPVQTTPNSKIGTSPSTSTFSNMLAGKKLPIWRKRVTPLYKIPEVKFSEEEGEPKPTRFEWPGEDQNSLLMSSPSFASISYESVPVMSSPVISTPSYNNKPLKRRVVPPTYPIADKIQKMEDGSEHQTSQIIMSDDDDDDDDGHFETLHNYDDSCDDDETVLEPPVNQLKPILKPATDTHNSTPLKKVRFSLENEDKENAETKIAKIDETNLNVTSPSQEVIKTENVPNHAKIIAEVLKKFPELVKNNKNIKLKITAPSSSAKPTALALDNKGKVATKASYVVLKSAVKTEKGLVQTMSGEKPQEMSNAENITGPWLCKTCGSEEAPMNFETYYLFRKHLQEVHLERIDSRICEYCGYKASKRNLHLYHLYTKHNVIPPKNIKFPKCNSCNYIALSESLLIKHQNNHQATRELTCHVCNTVFKTSSSLQAHIVTCKPNNESRNFTCKTCKKCFRTNVSLNAHIKVCQDKQQCSHVNEKSKEDTMEMIEVPVIETVDMEKGQHTLLQLPTGLILTETSNMTLLPSSESDALNNVASGIATSIGLTVTLPEDQAVILLDENSEFFLQGNNSVMVSDSQEYIVPDIMPDVSHIYSSEPSIPYAVNVQRIAYPVVHVQNDKSVQQSSSATQSSVQSIKISSGKDEPKQLFIANTQPNNIKSISKNSNQNISENAIPSVSENATLNINVNALSNKSVILRVEQAENVHSTLSNSPTPPDEVTLKELPNSDASYSKKSLLTNESEVNKVDNCENITTDKVGEDEIESGHSTPKVVIKSGESSKAKSLVRDWDFENDEDTEDVIDDPEVKPSRPTIDLQELS